MLQRINKNSHGEMVKHSGEMLQWCNNKHLHIIMENCVTNMAKWFRVLKISHGEMVKHSSLDILFTKCLNSETVMINFISPIFHGYL